MTIWNLSVCSSYFDLEYGIKQDWFFHGGVQRGSASDNSLRLRNWLVGLELWGVGEVTMLCVGAVTLDDVTICPLPAGTSGLTSSSSSWWKSRWRLRWTGKIGRGQDFWGFNYLVSVCGLPPSSPAPSSRILTLRVVEFSPGAKTSWPLTSPVSLLLLSQESPPGCCCPLPTSHLPPPPSPHLSPSEKS